MRDAETWVQAQPGRRIAERSAFESYERKRISGAKGVRDANAWVQAQPGQRESVFSRLASNRSLSVVRRASRPSSNPAS